jgi:hypothetical protein
MADDAATRTDFAGISALSSRPAGYAVASKCLQVQADAESADASLRRSDSVTLHENAWSWFTGAMGEIEVGRLLTQLGPEWFVRHAVPIGAGTKDVDHLVIGPGGVFAINTKHHAGASVWVGDFVLRVNNANTHHLKAAQSDAADVARRLSGKVGFAVPVTSVVVVVGAKSIVDRRATDARPVAVVDSARLIDWLRAQPRAVSETVLALIEFAAEEPQTWHIDPHAADTFRVMQRFERLVEQVGPVAKPGPAVSAPRRTRAAGVRSRAPRSTASRRPSARRGPSSTDLVKLWFAMGLIVAAILMLRGVANQPCTGPTACMVPALYLGLKPILMLALVGAIGLGIVGTSVWLVRRVTR